MKEVLYIASLCALIVFFVSSVKISKEPDEATLKEGLIFLISAISIAFFLGFSYEESNMDINAVVGFLGVVFCIPVIIFLVSLINLDMEMAVEQKLFIGTLFVAIQVGCIIGLISYVGENEPLRQTLFFASAAVFAIVFTGISLYLLFSKRPGLTIETGMVLFYSITSSVVLGGIGYFLHEEEKERKKREERQKRN